MKVSLIYVARSLDQCSDALRSLSTLDVSSADYEVLLALGTNPSEQRNRAAAQAEGDYLLFLDNDSIVDRYILRFYEEALQRYPAIEILGGPAMHTKGNSLVGLALSALFSSRFGSGPFVSRYSSRGEVRPATERDLILCNLLVKRRLFQGAGGFRTELYPGEENEFLNRIESRIEGSSAIYYHPQAVCYRDPPGTIGAFAWKLLRYGEGRAKHMLLFPRLGSNLYVLPALFALFVLLAAGVLIGGGGESASWWARGAAAAVFLYLLLASAFSLGPAIREKRPVLLLLLPLLFLFGHFSYGMGLLWGALRYPFLRSNAFSPMTIIRLKEFGKARAADVTPVAEETGYWLRAPVAPPAQTSL